jgi:hypothetical protein
MTSHEDTIYNTNSIFQISDKYVICPIFNSKTSLETPSNGCISHDDIVPFDSYNIMLPKRNYDILFKKNNDRKNHIIIWGNDNYIVFIIKSNNLLINMDFLAKEDEMRPKIFEKDVCCPLMGKIDRNNAIQSICEISPENLQTFMYKGCEILNKLFEKYFGDNIIIPYDMEERKKLYPLAFEELKDYMKDYE